MLSHQKQRSTLTAANTIDLRPSSKVEGVLTLNASNPHHQSSLSHGQGIGTNFLSGGASGGKVNAASFVKGESKDQNRSISSMSNSNTNQVHSQSSSIKLRIT